MSDELLDRILTKASTASYRRRSVAYRWLRERHDRLAPALNKLDPALGELAKEMAEGGITGGRGNVLTAKSLMTIWQRVCRDLQAETAKADLAKAQQAAAVKARGGHPSRLPVTWRPPVAQQAMPVVVQPRYPPPGAPAPASTPPTAAPVLNDKARAMLDSLDRQLAHRDRFINPPKRKD
jgi:hypothetical protein